MCPRQYLPQAQMQPHCREVSMRPCQQDTAPEKLNTDRKICYFPKHMDGTSYAETNPLEILLLLGFLCSKIGR